MKKFILSLILISIAVLNFAQEKVFVYVEGPNREYLKSELEKQIEDVIGTIDDDVFVITDLDNAEIELQVVIYQLNHNNIHIHYVYAVGVIFHRPVTVKDALMTLRISSPNQNGLHWASRSIFDFFVETVENTYYYHRLWF